MNRNRKNLHSARHHRFKTWPDMLAAVTKSVESFEKRWSSAAVPFFRGHSSTAYELVPSLLRCRDEKWFTPYDEENLYYEFRARAGVLLPPNMDSWEVLFVMQHSGVPTRLLDWTESFAAALFFALSAHPADIDIWLLDPYRLNQTNFREHEILDIGTDFKHSYAEYFVDQPRAKPEWKTAVAIYPPRRSARLAGQTGTFTLHITHAPLETLAGDALTRFTLDAAAWHDAKRYLKVAGIDDFALFPDLDGLARLLNKRFFQQNACEWP